MLPEKYKTTDSDEIKATERLRISVEKKSLKRPEKISEMSVNKLALMVINKLGPIVWNTKNWQMLHILMSAPSPTFIGPVNPSGGPPLTPVNPQTSPITLSSDPYVNSGKIYTSGFNFSNKNFDAYHEVNESGLSVDHKTFTRN